LTGIGFPVDQTPIMGARNTSLNSHSHHGHGAVTTFRDISALIKKKLTEHLGGTSETGKGIRNSIIIP
jgi:hypothetical protein